MKRFNNEVEKALKEIEHHKSLFDTTWNKVRELTLRMSLMKSGKDNAATSLPVKEKKSRKQGGNRPQIFETEAESCVLIQEIEHIKDELVSKN